MKKFKKIMAVLVAAMMIMASMTITAFAADKVITYNGNGETSGVMVTSSTNSDIVTLRKNDFKKTYHTFMGWSEDASATTATYADQQQINVSDSMTLFAVWRKNDVTVTYDINGGTGTAPAPVVLVKGSGGVATDDSTFSKTGYSFLGWDEDKTATSPTFVASAALSFDVDTILYAIWDRDDQTVTFDGNGGTGAMANQPLEDGQGTLNPNTYTRTEYTFIGWDGSDGLYYPDQATNVDITAPLTLRAKWSENNKNIIGVTNGKKGETYSIYKMLDLVTDDNDAPTGYTYTIKTGGDWEDFWTTGAGNEYIDTNTVGGKTYVVWKAAKSNHTDMEAFGKAAAAYVKNHPVSTPDATENPLGADGNFAFGNLENGYYLLTSTYGIAAAAASTPTSPVQTLTEKNNADTVSKQVQENATRNTSISPTNVFGSSNDAAMGEIVTFKTELFLAHNTRNVKYHDTMSEALSWRGVDTTKVYTNADFTSELNSSYYTVHPGTSPETFYITFDDENYVSTIGTSGVTLYIRYYATLNDKAGADVVRTNECNVTWGNAGKSADSVTTTTTHAFKLLKFDAANAGIKEAIEGAKFKLYTTGTLGEGTAIQLVKSTDGYTYRLYDGTNIPTGFELITSGEIVTKAGSKPITIEGIDNDDYWLEETQAPLGYQPLTARHKVTVDTVNEVENKNTATLPTTGGMGTTVLYIVGGMLVILAGAYLFFSRKKTA